MALAGHAQSPSAECTLAAAGPHHHGDQPPLGLIYRSADAEVTQGMPHPVRAMPLLSTVLVRRQLAHLPATLAHKQALAQRYQQALAALPSITQWGACRCCVPLGALPVCTVPPGGGQGRAGAALESGQRAEYRRVV
jgi:hypothetical protein